MLRLREISFQGASLIWLHKKLLSISGDIKIASKSFLGCTLAEQLTTNKWTPLGHLLVLCLRQRIWAFFSYLAMMQCEGF